MARVTQWEVNPTLASSIALADTDSGGYTSRWPGRWDCTFSISGKFSNFVPQVYDLFMPGDFASVQLTMGTLTWWYFPSALCLDFDLSVNIDTEEVIGWSANWGANGAFQKPTI